jgi:hypothetical protein
MAWDCNVRAADVVVLAFPAIKQLIFNRKSHKEWCNQCPQYSVINLVKEQLTHEGVAKGFA